MKRLLILFSLFLSVHFYTFAQHSIQSSVFDKKNGQAIERADSFSPRSNLEIMYSLSAQ